MFFGDAGHETGTASPDAGPGAEASSDAAHDGAVQSGIRPSLFGFVVNSTADTDPELPFGTWRLWDDHAAWSEVETSEGTVGGSDVPVGLSHILLTAGE